MADSYSEPMEYGKLFLNVDHRWVQ